MQFPTINKELKVPVPLSKTIKRLEFQTDKKIVLLGSFVLNMRKNCLILYFIMKYRSHISNVFPGIYYNTPPPSRSPSLWKMLSNVQIHVL